MEDFVLQRTGQPPVKFRGEVIAAVDNQYNEHGKDQSRWHELTLYRTVGGRYVAQVEFVSLYQGEEMHRAAYHAADPAALSAVLETHDPLVAVVGFPPGATYDEKNTRLRADVTRRWQGLITALYRRLPADLFAEAID